MSRVIKEFKIADFDEYSFDEVWIGSPVFYDHNYNLESVCGKVVHISERRKVINVEFTKLHPLCNLLKEIKMDLKLDLVHYQTFACHPKTVVNFVVYLNHD